ncbi:DeoR/GlpR family DNA-binding transcription regulator [Paenibacillus sp. IITD108]|uniref:DeoR/GlpR family DNA-binding transcription regulator n=1 Tax=Paenibacillus sp. IITD108 TaxID=3116649 RepID=UPI002F40EE6B
MNLNTRQQQMLDQIQAENELKISDLKDRFNVTEMTIRRDLEKLEKLGDIRRTFGGVVWIGKDVTLQVRSGVLMDEKIRIGKQAAAFVKPGESIFIDSGSTTLQVARNLTQIPDIIVVTNALNVATELLNANVQVILTGGILRQATASMVGPITTETIARMGFDRVFLGATGYTPQQGFSNSNLYEVEIKKLAIKHARESYIVLDHTKFGTNQLFIFAPESEIQHVVTDQAADPHLLAGLQQSGVNVVTV